MTKGSVSSAALEVRANHLEHRVLEWARAAPCPPVATTSTVVLVHGYMDAAGTWDLVAPVLAGQGYRVLAPQMRGFGDGARAPCGSYYHFSDYIADLAAILDALTPGEPIALVGHSMGGTIATLYAGSFPEKVVRLANLEGLGPPDSPWEVGPVRMRRWIEEVRTLGQRGAPAPMSREEARRRLIANHPNVPCEVLDHRLPHLVREVENANGSTGLLWCFDPLHRTTSPVPFFARLFVEFAKRVACPVLFVSGGASGFHVSDEEERLGAFAHLERATLDTAGHMMHWTMPEELARLLVHFLK